MKRLPFVWRRIGQLLFVVTITILVLGVTQLSLLQQGVWLQLADVLYMVLLVFVGTGLVLGFRYMRQLPYYRQLMSLSANEATLERVLQLQGAQTEEQRVVQQIVHTQYRLYTGHLEQYRRQQEQHQWFVNQWVHQMKTPVSVIHLLTQQPQPPDSADMRHTLDSVQEETERLEHGLNMMLHTARLDKFELDLHIRQVELCRLVREAIHRHKKACIRYRIFPKLETSAETMMVETDQKWIAFVIEQLLSNAIKYSRNEPGSKTLSVVVAQDSSGSVLQIRDEGIGIAEHDLPRVYDAFFTGENGRLLGESTGMGLYLAKQVCARMGHRLDIASVLGEGTTVTLRFPQANTLHHVVR